MDIAKLQIEVGTEESLKAIKRLEAAAKNTEKSVDDSSKKMQGSIDRFGESTDRVYKKWERQALAVSRRVATEAQAQGQGLLALGSLTSKQGSFGFAFDDMSKKVTNLTETAIKPLQTELRGIESIGGAGWQAIAANAKAAGQALLPFNTLMTQTATTAQGEFGFALQDMSGKLSAVEKAIPAVAKPLPAVSGAFSSHFSSMKQQVSGFSTWIEKSFLKVSGSVSNLVAGLTSMKLMLVGVGLYTGIRIVEGFIAAYDEQDQALSRLEGTMRSVGVYSESYSKRLQEQASALQEVTRFGDEQIMGVQQQLIMYGAQASNIEELTKLTIKFASAMAIDGTTAATLLGRAMQGQFETMARYGVKLNETMSDQEKLNEVLRVMKFRSNEVAETMGSSLTGRLAQAKNAWGDLKEEIGKTILLSQSGNMTALKTLFKTAEESIKGIRDSIAGTGDEKNPWLASFTSTGLQNIATIAEYAKTFASEIKNGATFMEAYSAASEEAYESLMGITKAAETDNALPEVQVPFDEEKWKQNLNSLIDLKNELFSMTSADAWKVEQSRVEQQLSKIKDAFAALKKPLELTNEDIDLFNSLITRATNDQNKVINQLKEEAKLREELYSLKTYRKGSEQLTPEEAESGVISISATRIQSLNSRISEQRSAVGDTRTEQDFQYETSRLEMLMQERDRRLKYALTGSIEAFDSGWAKAVENFGSRTERIGQIGSTLAESLDQNITDGLMGIVDGTSSVEEAFASMANSIVQDLIRVMVQQLLVRSMLQSMGADGSSSSGWLGSLSSAISSLGGSTGSGALTWTSGAQGLPTMHGGGVVGDGPSVPKDPSWLGASRFASGGLAGDEVPIIAHRPEMILNEKQMGALSGMIGSGNRGNRVEVINLTDPALVDERLAQNPGAILNLISKHRGTVRAALGIGKS